MVAFIIATFRCGGVLVVCVLMCSSLPSTNAEKIWKCSGKPTTYTYTDCETDRSVRDGCYYLVHFEQYRPCNDICDGVEMWSIDEERCRSYCPAYLNGFCIIQTPNNMMKSEVAQQHATTRRQLRRSTIGRRMTTIIPKSRSQSLLLVLIGVFVFVTLLTIISIAILLIYRHKSTHRSSQTKGNLAVQPVLDESYLESLKCGSHSEPLVLPKEASRDNEQNKKKEMYLVREDSAMMVD